MSDAPFSIFPSIFNDIDSYTKHLVHANIDKHGHPPKWLASLSEAESYKNVGFLKWLDEKNGILLKGGPDAVFDGEEELFVGDYKTARYRDGQDHLLAQYKVQLLGYSFLLEQNGYEKPKRAALIYFQPPNDPTFQELLARTEKTGMALPLTVEVVEIE
ncbi:MAG: PD-(D/E)XK nuclease family protein [Bryobacteraceae bacterium]